MLISFNIFISFVFLCYPAYIKRLKILRFNYRDQTTLHSSSFIQTKTPLTPPHSLQNLKTSHDTSHVRIITMDTCPLDLACVLDTYNTQPTFTSFVSPFFFTHTLSSSLYERPHAGPNIILFQFSPNILILD